MLEIMVRIPAFGEATCKRLRRTTKAVPQAVFYGAEEHLADRVWHIASKTDRGVGRAEPLDPAGQGPDPT
jgi:hypothetical protein